jgi:hypothetical protein
MESTDHLKKRFTKTESLVSRKVGSEFVIVPICRTAGEVESIYSLNEVAVRIWELIDGNRSVEQIRDEMVDEFEVSSEELEKDLVELLQQLTSIAAIQEA